MRKIGLISDTHHFLDPLVFQYFETCDEIWHAGDFGTLALARELEQRKPLKGVYGNIDGRDIRAAFPEKLSWRCEDINVLMIHIGGYPKKYAPGVRKAIKAAGCKLFVSGHSHILKIMYDEELSCLHINPGAAGNQGWHKVRTIVRFTIDGTEIRDCEVIELGPRSTGKIP